MLINLCIVHVQRYFESKTEMECVLNVMVLLLLKVIELTVHLLKYECFRPSQNFHFTAHPIHIDSYYSYFLHLQLQHFLFISQFPPYLFPSTEHLKNKVTQLKEGIWNVRNKYLILQRAADASDQRGRRWVALQWAMSKGWCKNRREKQIERMAE